MDINNIEEVISKNEVVDFLKEIICIESVDSRETEVAEKVIEVLEKEDISSYELIESSPGRGNLIVDLEGKQGSGYNLMIIGHFDVVPAGENWSVDPFGGIEKDGFIYGRGAIDDKGQVVAMTFLAVLLKRLNMEFKGRVRLLFAADEEVQDPKHGVRYLAKSRPDVFKGIDGAIGELGGLMSFGKKKFQAIFFAEKGYASFKIKFFGPGGHASQPFRVENPIKRIAEYISALPDGEFFISKAVKIMVRDLFGLKGDLITKKSVIRFILRYRNEKLIRMLHSLTHVTIAKTMIRAGDADNVIPDVAELVVNMRFFPEQDIEALRKILKKYIPQTAKNYTIENIKFAPSTYSDVNDPLCSAIRKAIFNLGYESKLVILPATSDSATVRRLGIPVFHFFTTKHQLEFERAHGVDERIHKDDLIEGIKGYYSLIKVLSERF